MEGPIRNTAAVVAADQSKAFERLSHTWLRLVLDGWRMPRWMVKAFLVMVIGRHVCSMLATGATKPRALLRGVGMGGTSSPLTWNVCFDPVLVALAVTVDAAAPTYVDDLMCLVRGPRQAFAAMIFLVAVSRCAGLHTEMPRCAWIEAAVEAPWAAVAFAALPVEVKDAGGGWTTLRGLPQAILEFLVIDMADGLTRAGIRYFDEECRCRVKTAVIPEEEVESGGSPWRTVTSGGQRSNTRAWGSPLPGGASGVAHRTGCGTQLPWYRYNLGRGSGPATRRSKGQLRFVRTRLRPAIGQSSGTHTLLPPCCTQGKPANHQRDSSRG